MSQTNAFENHFTGNGRTG